MVMGTEKVSLLEQQEPAEVQQPGMAQVEATPVAVEEEMKEVKEVQNRPSHTQDESLRKLNPLLIAREAVAVARGRRRRSLVSKESQETTELKQHIMFFFVSAVVSVLAVSYRAATTPEPMLALLCPHSEHTFHASDDSFSRFVARHSKAFIMLAFVWFASWLGFHGARSPSKSSLSIFKVIMTVWCIVSAIAAFLTIYAWTFLPIVEELLPRCDAQSVCMPYGDTDPSILQDCIRREPTAILRLPDECAWAEEYFLRNCRTMESIDSDPLLDEWISEEFSASGGIFKAIVPVEAERRLPRRSSETVCEINRPVIQNYHELIENFAIYLAQATVILWTFVLTFLMNALTSFSCIYVVVKFHQVHRRREILRSREMPLIANERTTLMV